MTEHAIRWRRLDAPGHETSRYLARDGGWHLTGSAAFSHDGQPCRLDYAVVCDGAWQTVAATVRGRLGERTVNVEIAVDAARRWWLDGVEMPALAGCIDIDIAFTPATNLLPLRRLGLAAGEAAPVRAAWLRFPGLTLEPLEQRYRRLDRIRYRYESGGGRYSAELQVNSVGFVTFYPGLCQAEPEV